MWKIGSASQHLEYVRDPRDQARESHLYCPGLLGPVPVRPGELPPLPALDRLAARARREPDAGPEDPAGRGDPGLAEVLGVAGLLQACGLPAVPGEDPPVAALCLLGESPEEVGDAYWLRADPVFLRPDLSRLHLIAGLDLTRDETDQLLALLNPELAAQGLRLVAPRPDAWYLGCARAPRLRTRSLAQVRDQALDGALFAGEEALAWTRWLTEVQMLLAQSPVNAARERAGRLPVNSLWLWGGGVPPALPASRQGRPDVLVGDDPLIAGLARHLGCAHATAQAWRRGEIQVPGRELVWWDGFAQALRARDLASWLNELQALDDWLAGVWPELGDGRRAVIRIETSQGWRFELTRALARRFWRRGRWERLAMAFTASATAL